MKEQSKFVIKTAALIGFLACLGDMSMTVIFGNRYPGYSQLHDTMSKLGASDSPVGFQMSLWWVILCFLFIAFAFGFRQLYYKNGKWFRTAFWLIVIYALGEGMGSGIFPANHDGNKLTLSLMIHDTLGGIGIGGIMVLPFALMKTISEKKANAFYRFSQIILYAGPVFLILFSIAKILTNPDNFIASYKGLWQRLLMLNYYVYLMVLAIRMWKESSKI